MAYFDYEWACGAGDQRGSDKVTRVENCHFDGVVPHSGGLYEADGDVALYLAPGSVMRGLYVAKAEMPNCNDPFAGCAPLGDECCNAPDDTGIEIGDIVNLVIGGPDMVVISICECGSIEVVWVDSDGDVCIDVFPEEALVEVVW